MSTKYKEIIESIRVTKKSITIHTMVYSMLENEVHCMIAPSLLVSGYGETEKLAKESFEHNLQVFCDDIRVLTKSELDSYLKSLGFTKEKLKSKNYSSAFIDKNGVLQGLENKTLKGILLQSTN